MKTLLLVATLFGPSAFGAEKAPDLTGQEVETFKAHDGKVVSLHGKLRKPGGTSAPASLIGVYGKGVAFYISPLTPPEGIPSWPKAWTDLVGQRVLVTGELHFVPLDKPTARDKPPGYFWMDPNTAKIEPLKDR